MSFLPSKVEYPGSENLGIFPNINLTRKLFQLKKFGEAKYPENLNEIQENIKKYNMGPFYRYICSELEIKIDEKLAIKMEEENRLILEKLDEKIEYASSQEGDLELRDCIIEKANYMTVIGSELDIILKILDEAFNNKTCSLGIKFRILFMMMRSCIFHNNRIEMGRIVKIAKSIGDDQIDWETRNKFKLYVGIYSIWNRDFNTATTLFHQILTTFSHKELVSFYDLGIYTILVSIICLQRNRLKNDIINAPEIQEATYSDNHIRHIPLHLYQCSYDRFFRELHYIESFASQDLFFSDHVVYLTDELRITAYKQLLCSFKSLKIDFLAVAIGQSVDDVDNNGKLACKIDKVNGLVYNSIVQKKDFQFQQLLQESDILLSKISYLIKHVC